MLASGDPNLDHCHHPLVRDLAWLVLAPDLICTGWPGRPSREALGLVDDRQLTDFLHRLEAAPQGLERRVGSTVDGRMGLYHERLWQFLLDAAPGTRLLAHNLRIHQGKRTLGELDLLYRRRNDPMPFHLEVAIKFYLGLPAGPGDSWDQARWIGPGGADSLASKREHLHRHQLRLTERAETRLAIRLHTRPRDIGPTPEPFIQPQLAMPGVLFYPWRQALPPPREAAHGHLRGEWLRWGEWRNFRDGLLRGTRAAWLAKPHWLALPRDEAFAPLPDIEARLAQHFLGHGSPIQIALLARGARHTGDGFRRLFVVADDWPRQIPLPPAKALG
ncbi:DUF1853 family protein [Halomonas chromatireducens]|uniref:DUF1853 domain-containing protein n=1 Tax=Halomonas chromatireducens TaxID=507626 RepID=A0A0X8HD75_9GAMM|nr:DUF1853 family protein [Halomonas chromatireducens]AMD00477.1 hypothetical protein LOKO_01409 [Halomonas chromatireducens]